MRVNCPICSDIILPSDVLNSTPCGHIFHKSCLDRWIERNSTCPQCRQECKSNIHRIYLPEVNFQDNDQLLERMNEVNRQKNEYECKIKKIEHEKKTLEHELKKKKKEFHRVMQRSLRKKATTNIPPRHLKNPSANVFTTQIQAHSSKQHTATSSAAAAAAQHQKKRRNTSRIQRSKTYFQRKRSQHRNINNNRESDETEEHGVVAARVINLDSPAISVSSDEGSN